MKRAKWEEDREIWILESMNDISNKNALSGKCMKRPVSATGQRRPVSAFAKMAVAIGETNPRFKSDNILNLELDMPERTTYDYEEMGVDERVQVTQYNRPLLSSNSGQDMHLGQTAEQAKVSIVIYVFWLVDAGCAECSFYR